MLIRGKQIKPAVAQTREALELFSAQLAARNRTDGDLAVLDRADADIAKPDTALPALLSANSDWHVGVARASHNELLIGS
jgi:GntR family transcriptional repressor for pyruvate dehydrogenase complex